MSIQTHPVQAKLPLDLFERLTLSKTEDHRDYQAQVLVLITEALDARDEKKGK